MEENETTSHTTSQYYPISLVRHLKSKTYYVARSSFAGLGWREQCSTADIPGSKGEGTISVIANVLLRDVRITMLSGM